MVLPVAYMAPADWYKMYLTDPEHTEIEGLESFEKQTFRNRALIELKGAYGHSDKCQKSKASRIMLTVPVKKVEHKQLTRDIEISYQSRWQHQHWISLVSAYKHTPYFDYYKDFFAPYYEKEIRFLWDLNNELHQIIMQLLQNSPTRIDGYSYCPTSDWRGAELNHCFGTGESILTLLFEHGPETTKYLI
jgi:hypothetical protein